jgi:hypothetical protein
VNYLSQHYGVLVFILLVVSMSAAVWYTLSIQSGWASLAERFGLRGEFIGRRLRWVGGGLIGPGGYYGILRVGANSEGLCLAVTPPFRLFHPPLFIPWTQIRIANDGRSSWGFVRFELGREQRVSLFLQGKAADVARSAAGGSVPIGLPS